MLPGTLGRVAWDVGDVGDDVDVGAGLQRSVLKGSVRAELLIPRTGRCGDGQNRPDRSGGCSDARCDDKWSNHIRTPKS